MTFPLTAPAIRGARWGNIARPKGDGTMWIFTGWHNNSHAVGINLGDTFEVDQNRLALFKQQTKKFVGSMGPGVYRCGLYHQQEIESAIWITEVIL